MIVYRTKGGYFYKELKNGKKTRISKDKYLKLKGNKHKKMKGGVGKVYELKKVQITDRFGLFNKSVHPDEFYVQLKSTGKIVLSNFKLYTNFDDGIGDYIYMKINTKKKSKELNNWESCWTGETPFQKWNSKDGKKSVGRRHDDNFPLIGRGYAYLRAIPFSFKKKRVKESKYEKSSKEVFEITKLQYVDRLVDLLIPKVSSRGRVKTTTLSIEELLKNKHVKAALNKYAAYVLSEFNQFVSPFAKSVGRNSVQYEENSVQGKINRIEKERRQNSRNQRLKMNKEEIKQLWGELIEMEREIFSEMIKEDDDEGPFEEPNDPGQSRSADSSFADSRSAD